MAVNVKLGVDIGAFKSGIKQGQQILKGLNAELKASESEFKATGTAEQKLANQTKTLTSQLNFQKGIADQARQALKAMTDAGVDPTDAAYQRLYVTLMNAEAGANDALAALNALKGGTEGAKKGAEELTNGLNNIGKKMSLEQVKNGIYCITTGLENAAKKAVQLGEELWNTIMDSARRADDTATMAEMYGIDLDKFQRMQKLVTGGMDTSVESMLASQKKLRKGVGNKSLADELNEIGVAMNEWQTVAGQSGPALRMRDSTELFWEAGQALMNLGDEYDKEAKAQAIFGRSWEELRPLFNTYKSLDEYNAALEKQEVNSEETIRDLAALNDAVGKLESSWETLKDELIGALAPALSEAATALGGLLDKLTEYLKTDEGQAMLTNMGNALSELLSGIGDISAEDVVKKFGDALDSVTKGLGWLADNKNGVVDAIKAIIGVWAGLKVGEGAMTMLKIINGLKDLTGLGGGAGGGGGAIGTGLFAGLKTGITNVAKMLPFAAPLLLGIDGLMHDQQLNAEGAIQTAEERQHITDATAEMAVAMLDSAFKQTWEGITAHTMSNKAVDSDVLTDWAERYNRWITTMGDDPIMDTLVENLSEGTFGELETLLQDVFSGATMDPGAVVDLLGKVQDELEAAGKDVELPSVLTVPDNAASLVAQQVGVVTLPASLALSSFGNSLASFFGIGSHANGIWSVPRDNYLAYLHKGERVVPAREVGSRSYSSNLDVESMVMNNGASAEGLAAAMAAAQRRTMSGYGS